MIGFELTNEQKQLQKLASDFALSEIKTKSDNHGNDTKFISSICQKAWELGLTYLTIEAKYGGLDLKAFDACLIIEELANASVAIARIVVSNIFAQTPLIVAGTDLQKKLFLEPLTTEFALASFCGTNIEDNTIVATSFNEDYVINGKVENVTNAQEAKWYCLLASNQSFFIIPSDTKGIEIDRNKPKYKVSNECDIYFHDVKIKKDNLLGQVGDANKILFSTLCKILPLKAATAVGLAHCAMNHSIQYAKQRITFGQPIANHQAVSFMLADMDKDIKAARLLTRQAAWLYDQDICNQAIALSSNINACDIALKAANNAVQIFGGYGYSREYPVEKLAREAKLLQLYDGNNPSLKTNLGYQFAELV